MDSEVVMRQQRNGTAGWVTCNGGGVVEMERQLVIGPGLEIEHGPHLRKSQQAHDTENWKCSNQKAETVLAWETKPELPSQNNQLNRAPRKLARVPDDPATDAPGNASLQGAKKWQQHSAQASLTLAEKYNELATHPPVLAELVAIGPVLFAPNRQHAAEPVLHRPQQFAPRHSDSAT
mmetsp:Transcript_17746/g.39144  ORF Transcript_17746/g.39144 Transcript_17746/m.39144 type:complete len:178 (-) Transcript_17746:449-982(-)